jgi:hypothetical protein
MGAVRFVFIRYQADSQRRPPWRVDMDIITFNEMILSMLGVISFGGITLWVLSKIG